LLKKLEKKISIKKSYKLDDKTDIRSIVARDERKTK